MEIVKDSQKCKSSIKNLKENILEIFEGLKANTNTEAKSLRNKSFLMDLRRKERELKMTIENQKNELNVEREHTEMLVDTLKCLEYEKKNLETEIEIAKDLEIRELNQLGIDLSKEKDDIMRSLKKEYEERIKLSDELNNLKQILDAKQSKLKEIEENIKFVPHSLTEVHRTIEKFQKDCEVFVENFGEDVEEAEDRDMKVDINNDEII